MDAKVYKVEALDWVLAKLSAQARAAPKAPTYKPPPPITVKPVPAVAKFQGTLTPQVRKDLELWHAWNTAPKGQKGEKFDDLMTAMSGVVHKHLNRFRGAPVNKTQMQDKAYALAYKAFTKYDPANPKGASPSTWLGHNLKGLKREVVKVQNTGRVTEPTVQFHNKFETARNELTEKLQREPSLHEIKEHSGLDMKQVLKIHREMRRDYEITGGGDEIEGAGHHSIDAYAQAAHIIYHDLKPHEKKVHELLFPMDGGRAITKSGIIAKKLDWDVSKVSKAKRVIQNRINAMMGAR